MCPIDERVEWLEADGLGGFASGTAAGIRTRRYHALLLSAASPPTNRQVLVAGADAAVTIGGRTAALSSQRYHPGVVHPDGVSRLVSFDNTPWPTWTYRIDDEIAIEQSLFVPKGLPITVLRWRLRGTAAAARLEVRLFHAGRDYHATHHENGAFRFPFERAGELLTWHAYDGVQGVVTSSNGSVRECRDWYRHFQYDGERARGLDCLEDLACPAVHEWDLASGDAVLVLAADTPQTRELLGGVTPEQAANTLAASERRRREAFRSPLERSADSYIVRRGDGATIVAGYPWFTDWGRDTFIALRGLCLATGRYTLARDILLAWTGAVSEGMLPNRFPDAGEAPEFNAVDASLWFIVAAHELFERDRDLSPVHRGELESAIDRILDGYTRGTRFGIRADDDGLLAAGQPGWQLTWMDARVGEWVVTPRIGKPVEVQALWINALGIASRFNPRWRAPFERARQSFAARFWNEDAGALYDVVDVDHVRGRINAECRPNQILAVGGLPIAAIEGDRARRIVDAVEQRLWTPIGLRSLAPDDPAYRGRYGGSVADRDGAYHQGTVWPWLIGPFVEAWVNTHGGDRAARAAARARFLEPLFDSLDAAGLGHLPEVADGDAPHAAGGCPFQAWSLGEAIRLDRVVLAQEDECGCDTSSVDRHPIAQ